MVTFPYPNEGFRICYAQSSIRRGNSSPCKAIIPMSTDEIEYVRTNIQPERKFGMAKMRVIVTGAAGYIASQMLPAFRERYELVLVDVCRTRTGTANRVDGVVKADLIDPDRSGYEALFQDVDAVVHLGYRRRSGEAIDHFFHEKENVEMAYNVLRTSYDAGAGRVAMASSNHAADWYEHALIHRRKMEVLDPYALPLSDNFYGWAKATYEHMGFRLRLRLPRLPGPRGPRVPYLGADAWAAHGRGHGQDRSPEGAEARQIRGCAGQLQERLGGVHQP